MDEKFTRTALLLGEENVLRFGKRHVAVFGIGGVGGYAVEALVRSGIGELTIVDKDVVSESNINRQIIATTRTVGQKKVDVMERRMREINPSCVVHKYDCFYLPETAGQFDFTEYDYVIDAVDTVTAKIEIILNARAAGVPVISAMGAGNKLDPSRFEVADIYRTSVCPLARVMRRELRKRGVTQLKVVYSKEEPVQPRTDGMPETKAHEGKAVPGSAAFVPPAAGLLLAGEVIRDMCV